jgi:sugar phosphate isomerase/epimerase
VKTRTGNYPIGLRRGGGDWQKDLPPLLEWATTSGLEVLDISSANAETAGKAVLDAGLRIGSVDLADTKGMISADKGRRKAAIERNSEQIRACAKLGAVNYFLVMLPDDPALPRSDNFGYMVESFGELAPIFEQNKAKLVIEGWPGPGALCCTPEGYRAFFKQVSSPAMGINYDPSHLIRMRVDHIRFLHEFGDRVFHMHGKDTEILDDQIYEYVIEQPATFAKPRPFAGMTWRYTVPGFGTAHWIDIFTILKDRGYQGAVSIELEDASFYKEPDAEKLGILQGARFLTGC